MVGVAVPSDAKEPLIANLIDFGGCQNPVTVGKSSIHISEGNPTNLHYPLLSQCLGRTEAI